VSYYLLKGRRGSLCSGTSSPVEPTHYIYAFLPKTHTPLVRLPNLLIIELSVKSPSVLPPYLLSFHPLFPPLAGKRKHRMKLSLPSKLVEKLVWVPVISFL